MYLTRFIISWNGQLGVNGRQYVQELLENGSEGYFIKTLGPLFRA